MIFIKQKNCIFLAVFIFCLIIFGGASSATTINVSPGTGTIQAAVTSASAGDTLNLSAGNYNDHAVTLNKNLTIHGPTVASGNPPTAVIDAQTSGRIFFINDGVTVTLQYLLFKNGYTDEEGGAVCNQGNLTINSCKFTNNNAESGGGAITNEVTGTCKVTNSTFSSNNAPSNDGGAFYNYYGSASIDGCTFTSNTATDYGGAIYNYEGNVTVTGSNVYNNTATNYGGGIYNNGDLTLTSSSVYNNTATIYAGGIYNYYSGTMTLTSSSVYKNNATNSGGGIFNFGTMTLTGSSSVYNNTATSFGGGIYNSGTMTLNSSSSVYNNTAISGDGGGIYNNGDLTLTSCSVYKNTATNYGGGIHNYSSGTTTLTNSNVYQNTATTDSGGGIYNKGTMTLTNSNVYNNTATTNFGGGIYNVGTINLTVSNVCNNTANDGGGIYNKFNLTLTNSNVYQNTATYGGGIFNEGTMTLTNSNVYQNTATSLLVNSGGGGICNYGSGTLTLTNSNVYNNSAWTDGGGIYIDSGTVNLTNSNVYQNTATNDDGGGIHNSGTMTLTNSGVSQNTATWGGGIFNDGTTILTGSSVCYNTATSGDGGGIYNQGTMTLRFCRIILNSAPSGTDIYRDYGSVDAALNWWGSNSDPSSKVSGGVDVSPWLVLNVTANPTLIKKNGTSNITADLLHDSTGGYHDPVSGHIPDGSLVSFATTKGSINSPVMIGNGAAKATLVGGAVSGVADVSSTLDSQTVHTSVTIDATAPTVTSTNPAQYAVNLPSNQVFTVTFSEAIKAGNLNLVVLKTSTGTVITTTKSITGNLLTITPTTALSEAKYLLMLYAGCVTDLAGNPVAATTRTYSVGSGPVVTVTDPVNYAVNVARNKVITATFNEPILAKYLTLVYLKTTAGIIIPTTKSVSGNTLTITPTSPLAAGTRYLVMIYYFAVTDLSGNPNVNKAISFTTGAT
jgi:predicted outer membrane repeat protein